MKDDLLETLPAFDLDPTRARHIERVALAVLEAERVQAELPLLRAWARLFEPSVAVGSVAIYLAWMVHVLRPLL